MSALTQRCRIVPIPGPIGIGTPGTPGTDGSNGWASLTAPFTMPAQLGTGSATVDHTDWMALGAPVYIETLGTFQIVGINSSTSVVLKNLQNGLGGYDWNAPPGTIGPSSLRVMPSGFQGIPASFVSSLIQYGGIGPPVSGVTPATPPFYEDATSFNGPYLYWLASDGNWYAIG